MNDMTETHSGETIPAPVSRRRFLHAAGAFGAGAFGAMAGLQRLAPAYALASGHDSTRRIARADILATSEGVDLVIDRTPFGFAGRRAVATTINGSIPGPLLRFRDGERVTIHVTNRKIRPSIGTDSMSPTSTSMPGMTMRPKVAPSRAGRKPTVKSSIEPKSAVKPNATPTPKPATKSAPASMPGMDHSKMPGMRKPPT